MVIWAYQLQFSRIVVLWGIFMCRNMLETILATLVLVTILLFPAPFLAAEAWRVVPGRSIGPLTLDMHPSAAIKMLGEPDISCVEPAHWPRKHSVTTIFYLKRGLSISFFTYGNELSELEVQADSISWLGAGPVCVPQEYLKGHQLEAPSGATREMYITDKGIRIGDPLRQVITAYGPSPYPGQGNILLFARGSGRYGQAGLIIILRRDKTVAGFGVQ